MFEMFWGKGEGKGKTNPLYLPLSFDSPRWGGVPAFVEEAALINLELKPRLPALLGWGVNSLGLVGGVGTGKEDGFLRPTSPKCELNSWWEPAQLLFLP